MKIKPSDIKIGNFLLVNEEVQTVVLIGRVSVGFDKEHGKPYNYKDVYPVPITEQWLLDFGFQRQPWGLVKEGLLFKDNLKCTELIFQVGNGFEVTIKYVHQLQNLYLALSGKELIKN